MNETVNVYDVLRLEDYKPFIETKDAGKYRADYLSWAVAWDKLKKNFPYAIYSAKEYKVNINGNELTLPYMVLPNQTGMVRVDLMLIDNDGDEHRHTEVLAIRDRRMQAVSDPDSCQIENTIRRCVAKGVSMLTGFGIELWFGEDIKDLDYKKPTHQNGSAIVAGNASQDQTLKLDALMRDKNCTEVDRAVIKSHKDNNWDLSKVHAEVIIADAKEGIRLNKKPTKTKIDSAKKLLESVDVDDSKKKELKDYIARDNLTTAQLESIVIKIQNKLEN
jgi:hypothetical protein